MGAIVYAAFFAALIAMPIYGGAAYDRNGYQPFKAPPPIFAIVILAAGLLAVSGASAGDRGAAPQGPLARHSTNTSSRRLRIIGRAAIMSRPAAIAINVAEIGRVRNTVASPRAINIARRKFSSISGPSTKASTRGAGSKSCLTIQ